MKNIIILLFCLLPNILFAKQKALKFSIETKNLIKKFPYGYEISVSGDVATVKLWKHNKENSISKKLKSSEYRYFVRDWSNRAVKKNLEEYQLPTNLKTDITVTAKITSGDETTNILYDRRKPVGKYVDQRIQNWLQYLELKILRTSSLKFRRM